MKALKYPESIEDEAHFLLQCTEDSDIKTDLAQQIAMEIPQFSYITDKITKSYPITSHISSPVYKSI